MKYLVCVETSDEKTKVYGPPVFKGEIYTYLCPAKRAKWICLVEFGTDWRYKETLFRPVDDTYGEVIAEILEKQLELEEVETINQ